MNYYKNSLLCRAIMFLKIKLKLDENLRKVMGSVEGDSVSYSISLKNQYTQVLTLKNWKAWPQNKLNKSIDEPMVIQKSNNLKRVRRNVLRSTRENGEIQFLLRTEATEYIQHNKKLHYHIHKK